MKDARSTEGSVGIEDKRVGSGNERAACPEGVRDTVLKTKTVTQGSGRGGTQRQGDRVSYHYSSIFASNKVKWREDRRKPSA